MLLTPPSWPLPGQRRHFAQGSSPQSLVKGMEDFLDGCRAYFLAFAQSSTCDRVGLDRHPVALIPGNPWFEFEVAQ